MVTANLDETPFLPDMGPFFQGAFHLHVEDLAEMAVREAAEPSEQTSSGHHLSKLDFFRPSMHWLCLQAWLWSSNVIGKPEEEVEGMFTWLQALYTAKWGHLHGLQG